MKTKNKTNYQEYVNINNDNNYEIINGELIMVPAPDFNHQTIQTNLGYRLIDFVKKNNLGMILFPPIDVKLSDDTCVQSDILFLSNERKNIATKRGISGSPDLVIEIVSKYSQYRDNIEKKEIYQNFKIKEYWIVNPYMKSVEVLVLENDKYKLFSESFIDEDNDINKVKSYVLKNFIIDLNEIFVDLI
ncbi:MAG: Uma2 family endonuclease [Candidatus Sericytochromatia bacterium]